MAGQVHTKILVHKGDIPGQLRVSQQNRWYVTEEVWEGSRIINTTVLKSFQSEDEARTYANKEEKKLYE